MTRVVGYQEGEAHLDWIELTDAMAAGFALPKAQIEDSFLFRGKDTLLQRKAWINGLGIAIKSTTVFPDNPEDNLPMIDGTFSIFEDRHGRHEAVVDFFLVTKWKTAADSLLAARRLARPDSREILVVGAGVVADSLCDAYRSAFPDAKLTIWNRNRQRAATLASQHENAVAADDLETAVRMADIITTATPSTEPLIKGDWLQPGQHLDLIGAFRPDMREADDAVFTRGRVFIDCYETIIGHIGEIMKPIETGSLDPNDIVADYYDLAKFKRNSDDEITIFKNGGGAHLDLMTARYVLDKLRGT